MSAAGAERAHRADVPRTSGVSMGALLAAGVAATAVSTPPAPGRVRDEGADAESGELSGLGEVRGASGAHEAHDAHRTYGTYGTKKQATPGSEAA